MKILYFDVETTGLDPTIHDIIQLSYILEVDGDIVCSDTFQVRPANPERADPAALAVHGISIETMMAYRDAKACKVSWEEQWANHIDKYDPSDKALPCAYNGAFDLGFLSEFYQRENDRYLGSWISLKDLLDPLAVLRFLRAGEMLCSPDLKLSSVARHYGIELHAHDAQSDTRALREISRILFTWIRSAK